MENVITNAYGTGNLLSRSNLMKGCTSYSATSIENCSGDFARMLHPASVGNLVTVSNPYDKFSPQEREAMAHTWHFHLISAECTFAEYLYNYVRELEQMMSAHGLLKFNAKRLVNELKDTVQSMQVLVKGHGRAQIKLFCVPIFAPMADEYYNIGGDLTSRIVLRIRKRIDEEVTRLFYCTKNMLNRTGCPYADVLNHLQMIMFVVTTDIEFSDVVRDRARKLLDGTGKEIQYTMSNHNARIVKAARQLILQLYNETKYPFHKEDMENVRTLARVIQERLVGERTRDAMDEEIWGVRGDFTLFVLLRLAMRLQGHGEPVSRKELKHLLFRLGTKENVRAFVKELRATAIPEGEGMIDRLEGFDIPESSDTLMQQFFRLCLEDKSMYRPFSSDEEVKMRNIRQMVYYSKDSTISDSMLRYIFIMKGGVKKRVEEFLSAAGTEVMRKTLRKLKKMKVTDLQGRKGRYYFDFFKGIDELRKERGLSDKDMMQAMGLGKTKYYGMKKVTSMRYTRGDEISRLIRDLSTFMKVDASYYLYLCIRETDNELVSEQTVEYVLRRGIVVYLTNNEIRAEMDSGEEYQLEG